MRKRKNGILIYLSDEERKHLEKQAKNAALNMSAFIRKSIMDEEITPRPPENVRELLKPLDAIGNNINQIARKVNTFNKADKKDLDEIYRLLSELYHLAKH